MKKILISFFFILLFLQLHLPSYAQNTFTCNCNFANYECTWDITNITCEENSTFATQICESSTSCAGAQQGGQCIVDCVSTSPDPDNPSIIQSGWGQYCSTDNSNFIYNCQQTDGRPTDCRPKYDSQGKACLLPVNVLGDNQRCMDSSECSNSSDTGICAIIEGNVTQKVCITNPSASLPGYDCYQLPENSAVWYCENVDAQCGDVVTFATTCPSNCPKAYDSSIPGYVCQVPYVPAPAPIIYDICAQAGPLESACRACGQGQFWTTFGCVPTDALGITRALIRLGTSIAGGIAILSILYGAFKITIARTNPSHLQAGRELITSSVIGLIFIIFAVIMYRFIAQTLLKLPGI